MDGRVLVILCFAWIKGTATQKCPKEAKADAVSWTIYYKMPGKMEAQALYADAATSWAKIADLSTPPDNGLDALVKKHVNDNKADYNIIAYSNFPSKFRSAVECASSARGILGWMANTEDAWYIMHTADQWPDFNDYAPPPVQKAALFVCVTVPNAEIGNLATVLDYQDPIVFYYQKAGNPPNLEDIPEAKALTVAPKPRYSPYVKNAKFTSAGASGVTVRVVGKLSTAVTDIYSSYLTVLLKRNLTVWSKPKSGKLLESSCTSTYKVENVVPTAQIEVNGVSINRDDDSSSWAISKTGNMFCASSADRTEESKKVGAGVLCLQQKEVTKLFRSMANKAKTEACK